MECYLSAERGVRSAERLHFALLHSQGKILMQNAEFIMQNAECKVQNGLHFISLRSQGKILDNKEHIRIIVLFFCGIY